MCVCVCVCVRVCVCACVRVCVSARSVTLHINYLMTFSSCMLCSAWARTTKRGFSLPVSGQRLIMFFGELIMSRIQNDVIAVLIL